MKKYQHLFSPLTVKRMTLKNRVVMPPMGTNFAGPDGSMQEKHIKYYEQRAKGGTGLIVVENAAVEYPLGSNGTTQIRMDHDSFIPGMYQLTERLHNYGACVALQINHSGASAVAERIGMQAVSASDIPSKKGGGIPRPLEQEEILDIVKYYGKAAKRVQMAGFDAVEIHAGHSYLICQFLSPLYNKRTDEFGGSMENRTRFARMIIDEVRAQVGPFFPIMLRVSADEFVKGGNTLDDTLALLEFLNDEVDIFNVSAGVNDSLQYQIDKMNLADGWRSYMAKAVKDKFGKPTMTTGNIRNPEVAEKLVADGEADLIGMGRGLIAEPKWVEKVAAGNEAMLRKCISCNIGCAGHRIALNRPICCTINPDLINEDAYLENRVNKQTNVVVIGGGTAGLEAACTAAEVGCQVTLFEGRDYLGGLARDISFLPDKERIGDFPDYLIERSRRLKNLVTLTGVKADIATLDHYKPDIVVNATGSKPILPPIAGLLENVDKSGGKVKSISGMIAGLDGFTDFADKKIVVVGGGAVGLDVVEFFAERGAAVTIIERLPALGQDLDVITRLSMMQMIDDESVSVRLNTSLMEVGESYFKVSFEDVEEQLDFDYGFVCLGMRPEKPDLSELENYYVEQGVEVVNIGDSRATRKILDGVREGRNILKTLVKINAL
ncbi:FAD-dependent oxidoreductase [Listeria weihenstephanensis]|uniref:FAD-dependent oxidoreductase n=1 Tax=Listeria weihenstephanensis TaxID=1006155 RepID=A0A841Z3B8_9LIST|nr:FAD-dependent oxidoreductase [Listeria weihenstephanensis]MBC1499725.1 FAD-dependent oxidoreductase [Listeria weihenstephanensis]